MHSFTLQSDGWTLETLADDSDLSVRQITAEGELQGCVFMREVRRNNDYISEIRYEEERHNQLVLVEAIVFKQQQSLPSTESTERDITYFRLRTFLGDNCKINAAEYAHNLKKEIDQQYFSNIH